MTWDLRRSLARFYLITQCKDDLFLKGHQMHIIASIFSINCVDDERTGLVVDTSWGELSIEIDETHEWRCGGRTESCSRKISQIWIVNRYTDEESNCAGVIFKFAPMPAEELHWKFDSRFCNAVNRIFSHNFAGFHFLRPRKIDSRLLLYSVDSGESRKIKYLNDCKLILFAPQIYSVPNQVAGPDQCKTLWFPDCHKGIIASGLA